MTDENTIPLSHEERGEWNNFVTHLDGDYPTSNAMASFQKLNPKTTLTDKHIPAALNEVAAIKKEGSVPGLTKNYVAGNNMNYPVDKGGKPIPPPDAPLPTPNYDDPNSRLDYAKKFRAKYGDLMQGRGDTPLRLNEIPDSGSIPAKQMAINSASKYGLDPAVLYSSAMEEGMSGIFGNKKGEVDFSGDEKHPISGFVNFGLDNFADKYPELVKKGLLDKGFASKFSKSVETNEKNQKVNSANFATAEDALQAKAAMVKDVQDTTEKFASKNNIKLSPAARDFFTLVAYNGGEGNMQKMLKEYNDKGYLKDDKFIEKRPSEGWAQIHTNISRRLLMANALKKEKLF